MKLELIFKVAGAVLSAAAIYFYFESMQDAAFGAGVGAVSAFFLSYRFTLKARVDAIATKPGDDI